MVKCEFCGKEIEKKKLNSHRGACRKYHEFKDTMAKLEEILKEKWIKGEFTDVSQISIIREREIEKRLADINLQLGEIRGLVRKILEKI